MPRHQHGWDCFKTSGGYTNAFEQDRPLAERIEVVYKTAYRTGHKNGFADRSLGDEQIIDEQQAVIARLRGLLAEALPNLDGYVVMAADQPGSLWSRIHAVAELKDA